MQEKYGHLGQYRVIFYGGKIAKKRKPSSHWRDFFWGGGGGEGK